MMIVLKVVPAAFLLLAAGVVAGQKPTTLDKASANGVSDPANGPVLGILDSIGKDPPGGEGDDDKRNETFGKDLDSEEEEEEEGEGKEDDQLEEEHGGAYSEEDIKSDNHDDDDDDDDDSDEYDEYYDYEDEDDEEGVSVELGSIDRFKRKVIFRGGGGGGIYTRGGRRGGGGGAGYGEDPYDRRRGGSQGGYGGPADSWPYRRQDMPYQHETNGRGTTLGDTTQPKGRTSSEPVYGTTRTSPSDVGGSSKASTGGSAGISGSNTSSGGRRGDGKRTKTERRETSKAKLSKNLKLEIAKYALQHGPHRAIEHFESRLGRKLRVKKVEKFVKRYQSKM